MQNLTSIATSIGRTVFADPARSFPDASTGSVSMTSDGTPRPKISARSEGHAP
jgi:hypothetical protein